MYVFSSYSFDPLLSSLPLLYLFTPTFGQHLIHGSVHYHGARHTCTVLSALPEARRVPSGDQATVHTGSEWPRKL